MPPRKKRTRRSANKESTKLRTWKERTRSADKDYEKWEEKYNCAKLEDYYLGHQWAEEDPDHYTINLVFPTIETQKPSLLFFRPSYHVKPKPPYEEGALSTVNARAKLREHTLDSVIEDEGFGFKEVAGLCLHETHFRFGMVEVGYTADFIDNPNAGKPLLLSDVSDVPSDQDRAILDENGNEVLQPERIPESERIFIKRIPAKQFRVSVNSKNQLGHNDWVGYWEWQHLQDVKRNKNYRNTASIRSAGKVKRDFGDGETDERSRGMVKLWKIWDLRAKVRHVFIDTHEKFLIEGEDFKHLPFAPLKFHERLDDWYPLPPVFNWISPQNELNETREMQRVHRRRFYRRYGHTPDCDEGELVKLETGGDGVRVELPGMESLWPIPDAPLDNQVVRNIPFTKEDFREITGVSGDQRGVAESETATQANIIDARSRIRESMGRGEVAQWLSEIGRLVLLNIEENMSLPFWIKTNVDLSSPEAPIEASEVARHWQEITSETLGDLSYSVNVSIESLSPVAQEAERNAWNQVLALLSNPSVLFVMSQSETLMRKTLALYGITRESEIREIQRISVLALQALSGQQSGPGGSATPSNTDIQKQLQSQLGIVQ